ncbi:MAG: hypothetical protein RIR51_1172 [Bacteroidota bacterium]
MKQEELIRYSIENLYFKNKIKGPSIWWLLFFPTSFFLFSLPYIQIEISSQAKGIVRPLNENTPIFTLNSGKIKFIHLENNQVINKGDLLIELESEALENQSQIQEELLSQCLNFQQDLHELMFASNPIIISPEYLQDFHHFILQKKELESKILANQKIYDRQNKLFKERVIAQAEWEKAEFELIQSQETLLAFVQNKKREWAFQSQKEIEKEKTISNALEKIKIDKKSLKIYAPISGTIIQYQGIQTGNYISSGMEIAKISPNDSLIIECFVKPQDIGLIHPGQSQKISVDAFNYRQFGWLEAKVVSIDRNIMQDNNSYFFKVRSKILKNELKMKNGFSLKAEKGMTINAHFYLNKRTLFQLLTDKMDDWFNPNQAKNNGINKNKTT